MNPSECSAPIFRLVITGGPSAGKTNAIERIRSVYTARGWEVITVPETATELIQGGLTPWTCSSVASFQALLFHLQRAKEEIFFHFPRKDCSRPCLILLDRGLMDGKAYLPEKEFADILAREDLDESAICSRYDAVFHLVSASCGAEDFYTLANNSARFETLEDAVQVEHQTQKAWSAHPKHCVIPTFPCFEDKLDALCTAIDRFLSEPAGTSRPKSDSGKENETEKNSEKAASYLNRRDLP